MVGAVLVRSNRIIATGFHPFAGADHAEIVALKRAGAAARGATLYINLEPCNHHGKTPPCTDALIRAGVKEVVAGMKDPNPLVAGRGFGRLRRAGIRVRSGLLNEECRALNEAFVKFITRRMPFVTLKLAASLDGKIATVAGDARWISGPQSRAAVHRLRDRVDAVLVGAGTAIADDPQLTCRIRGGRNPWRIVLDGGLRMRASAKLFHQRDPEKTVVVVGTKAPAARARSLEARGARVWKLPLRGSEVSWTTLLRKLAGVGIVSIMIEGGATVAASALRAKVVDKVIFFYAPKILGGDGRVMIDPLGIGRMERALRVKRLEVRKLGRDLLVSAYL